MSQRSKLALRRIMPCYLGRPAKPKPLYIWIHRHQTHKFYPQHHGLATSIRENSELDLQYAPLKQRKDNNKCFAQRKLFYFAGVLSPACFSFYHGETARSSPSSPSVGLCEKDRPDHCRHFCTSSMPSMPFVPISAPALLSVEQKPLIPKCREPCHEEKIPVYVAALKTPPRSPWQN